MPSTPTLHPPVIMQRAGRWWSSAKSAARRCHCETLTCTSGSAPLCASTLASHTRWRPPPRPSPRWEGGRAARCDGPSVRCSAVLLSGGLSLRRAAVCALQCRRRAQASWASARRLLPTPTVDLHLLLFACMPAAAGFSASVRSLLCCRPSTVKRCCGCAATFWQGRPRQAPGKAPHAVCSGRAGRRPSNAQPPSLSAAQPRAADLPALACPCPCPTCATTDCEGGDLCAGRAAAVCAGEGGA